MKNLISIKQEVKANLLISEVNESYTNIITQKTALSKTFGKWLSACIHSMFVIHYHRIIKQEQLPAELHII